MRNGEGRLRLLALLTIAAPACLCALCLADWAVNGGALALCGAGVSAAAVILAAALVSSARKMVRAEWQRKDMEIDRLKQACEEEIRQLQKEKKRENEQFRSSLAHSLRMPVAIIQGYAELLAGGMVSEEEAQKDYLEKIVQRSRYMSDVMSRHFSGGELNNERILFEEIDILELVRKAVVDIKKAAEEKGVVVQMISTEDTVMAMADGYLLNRVIFNLLENSLKYMGRPGVVMIRVLKQNGLVSLMVQDDGLGMDPEEASRVFEPRFQGSNRSGGSGYGLYLVKQAVEAHGGIVTAQSAPGRGMGIVLTLPLKHSEFQN